MMRLLVTGGAGFIGSNFIVYMLDKHPDYRIVNLDKLTYAGRLENLREVEDNPNYVFIKGDICNENLVDLLTRDVDAIVNFAAETHVDRSIQDPEPFIRTNIYGTYTLLKYAQKNGCRMVQVSTDEVYGQIFIGSFRETDKLEPRNPYSATKASADMLCLSFHKTYDLPVVVTRSTNNYGPRQHPEKLIPKIILNALQNKPIPIYGDGMHIRDWLYVLDNCEAIDLVLHKGKNGEIYNIGAGNERTNLEVVRLILNLLNRPEKLITFVKDRPAHDRRYSVNWDKIKTLGWRPKTTFIRGLKETIGWYLNAHSNQQVQTNSMSPL